MAFTATQVLAQVPANRQSASVQQASEVPTVALEVLGIPFGSSVNVKVVSNAQEYWFQCTSSDNGTVGYFPYEASAFYVEIIPNESTPPLAHVVLSPNLQYQKYSDYGYRVTWNDSDIPHNSGLVTLLFGNY